MFKLFQAAKFVEARKRSVYFLCFLTYRPSQRVLIAGLVNTGKSRDSADASEV
jgi:hypothetical protein